MKPGSLILASASPRRRELLGQLGLAFSVFAVSTPEKIRQGLTAAGLAKALALEKAQAAANRLARPQKAGACCKSRPHKAWVLGADTLVWLEGRPLGKPSSPAAAAAMLRRLSGRQHQVVTGLALVALDGSEKPHLASEATRVFFRKLSEEEIAAYVATGGPLDKAGAYGIQEQAGSFVRRIEGCYFNVVGLPLARTWELLGKAGVA
jgi:septum formation protein